MARLHAPVLLVALTAVACQGKSQGGTNDETRADAPAVQPAEPTGDPELVRLGELLVEGERDGGSILAVVHAERGTLAQCYEQARKADPTVAGELGIRFFIKADGTVPDAILHNAKITDRTMGRCLMNAFKTLQFPAAAGDTKATLPMSFGDAPPPEQAG